MVLYVFYIFLGLVAISSLILGIFSLVTVKGKKSTKINYMIWTLVSGVFAFVFLLSLPFV